MRAWRLVALVAGGIAVACGAGNMSSDSGFSPNGSASPPTENGGTAAGSGSGGGSGGLSADAASQLPPEQKAEQSFKSPVSTGHIVWIANPASGQVAYIDATSLAVKTVAAGDAPTYLSAVPAANGDDVAIVLNALSHDATLLRVSGGVLAQPRTFPVTSDGNSWAVSASGRWALAWADSSQVTSPDPTQGYQDVAVLDLAAPGQTPAPRPPTIVAVGYRPVTVAFSHDETRAYAVTQDGISVVDLVDGAQPTVTANYPIPQTALDGGSDAPDVSITSDGAFALVRQDGVSSIAVIALADGTTTTVPLPSAPTDLTLSPTGAFALAVMRDTSTIAQLPIPGIASDPTTFTTIPIPGETIGRAIVTASGQSALLFTTVAAIDHLTVLSLGATPSFRVIDLHAQIFAVFPTPDAQYAVVLHQITPTATTKGAFSVVPIAGDLPAKIVGTTAVPTAVAIAPTSDRVIVSTRDDASQTYGFYLAKMPTLEVDPSTLASPPTAVGIAAAATRGFIAQDYTDGRITFVDLGTGDARTITGFELGSRVVDDRRRP